MPAPAVSIVVPTRNRPASLARCLARLDRQSGCGPFEIIVVDDASRDAARVAEAVTLVPRARLLRLDGRGPAAARNAGARAAQGSILCFTDDDFEPPLDWAARLVEAVLAGADAVSGQTVSVPPDHPFTGVARAVGESLREAPSGTVAFAASGNMACRADVFRAIPFDERYAFACEDRDWSVRLTAGGYRLVREPGALSFHNNPETLDRFLRRHVRYGEGAYLFRQLHSKGRPGPPRFYARLIRRGFREGLVVGVLVVLSQVAVAVGFARAGRRAGA